MIPLRLRPPHAARGRALAWCGVFVFLMSALPGVATDLELPAGIPLVEALETLRSDGLALIWSSSLVTAGMHLQEVPLGLEPRKILDEILAPHGLTARQGEGGTLVVVTGDYDGPSATGVVRSRWASIPLGGVAVVVLGSSIETETDAAGRFALSGLAEGVHTLEARRPGFVVEQLQGVEVRAGRTVEVELELQHTPLSHEEIVVVPSRLSLLSENPAAPLSLSREEVHSLPHLGDDVFRTLTLLPGVTGNDLSAQFHVRGGRRDEVQILLDGQELYEAFHLKDFDNALSIVGAGALESVDLLTGGFQAPFGDRMSGVLDMTTVTPREKMKTHLGASLLTVQAGSSGTSSDGGGHWLGLARKGSTEIAERVVREDQPNYWDAYGKLERRFGDRDLLRVNALGSMDDFAREDISGDELGIVNTSYDSAYAWLTHQRLFGSSLVVETAASWSRVKRDRQGLESEEEQQVEVLDRRDLEVGELRQRWDTRVGERHGLTGGFALREFDADYSYIGIFDFETPIAGIRDLQNGTNTFTGRVSEHHGNIYLVDRFRPTSALTVELGLRFDRHTLSDEELTSPRFNLAYTLGESTVLRAAWGHFFQSQRPYELQVEDGEPRFFASERSEHRLLGLEHHFQGQPGRPLAVRLELYQRIIRDPRQRFENLYEPLNVFPEFEPDRFRLAPEDSSAEGVELLVRGRMGREVDWWASYAYAETEDEAPNFEARRPVDQPHAFNLSLAFPLGSWRLNFAWRHHTGWPTTLLSLEEVLDDDGEIEVVPVLGPINSERLPDYHRLDLRISRRFEMRLGSLVTFLDVQNVYDRHNLVGFDHTFDEDLGQLVVEPEEFEGLVPSAGLRWEF